MSERVRVKALLRELDILQRDFAEEIGVHPVHLCHVLAGRRPFSRQLARGVSNAMKLRGQVVDAGALVIEEGEGQPEISLASTG